MAPKPRVAGKKAPRLPQKPCPGAKPMPKRRPVEAPPVAPPAGPEPSRAEVPVSVVPDMQGASSGDLRDRPPLAPWLPWAVLDLLVLPLHVLAGGHAIRGTI